MELFKVQSEDDLVTVARKVLKSMRALPVLESFCNDICKEVFE